MPLELRPQVPGVPCAVHHLPRPVPLTARNAILLLPRKLHGKIEITDFALPVIELAAQGLGSAGGEREVETAATGGDEVHGEAGGPGDADGAGGTAAAIFGGEGGGGEGGGGGAEGRGKKAGEEEGAEAVCGDLQLVALGGFGA